LISVLTPVHNTPPEILRATLASLRAQTYDRWEVCLVAGGLEDPRTRDMLHAWAAADQRYRVEFLAENRGIAGNTNVALAMARGEFIALLDHDDVIAPFALFEVVHKLNERPSLDFIYSDKDLITKCGTRRFNPLFKPAWSPAIMFSANYLTHLNVIRTERARQVGGFRSHTDGAQDWDFFFRVLHGTDQIAHIPRILYHWRHWEKSAASGHEAKPYVSQAQRRTLEEHVLRTSGRHAQVQVTDHGYTRIRLDMPAKQLAVSVIVSVTSDSGYVPALIEKLRGCVQNEQLDLLIAHSGPLTESWQEYYERLGDLAGIQVLCEAEADSVWTVRNRAARQASGDALLFLDGDVEIISDDWLTELTQWLMQPGIGVVGAKLLRPDGAIHHAGLVLDPHGFRPMFAGLPERACGLFGSSEWYRNYLAVSGACLLIHRSLFLELGGFDEAYHEVGADIELCLRVHERGLQVFYNPFARLRYHATSATAGSRQAADQSRLKNRCQAYRQAGDPFANVNLLQGHPAVRLPLENRAKELERADLKVPATVEWIKPGPANEEGRALAARFDFDPTELESSQALQSRHAGPLELRSINWFIPSFHHAYFGGIYTVLRLANYLHLHQGVESRFCVVDDICPEKTTAAIVQAFPTLNGVKVYWVRQMEDLRSLEDADACVATLWKTAYSLLRFKRTKRKFYMIQDYEPLFYAAGSASALAEATYRFGFYGLANTVSLKQIYERDYGGIAVAFRPCVDTAMFHPAPEPTDAVGKPFRVFFYGRPNNPRNGFELGAEALRRLKKRLGSKVQIVAAGEYWRPADFGLEGVVDNLGLLDMAQTAALYRECHAGLVLMFTRHPSYLPLEFMASGCLTVTNWNLVTGWLLHNEKNCLLAHASAGCIAETLERGLLDVTLRHRITAAARRLVEDEFTQWAPQFQKVFAFMCNPTVRPQTAVKSPEATSRIAA
jgi:GT2 family glycosyltransferase/glycosyltransferase involved in cell wall biosynthesis